VSLVVSGVHERFRQACVLDPWIPIAGPEFVSWRIREVYEMHTGSQAERWSVPCLWDRIV